MPKILLRILAYGATDTCTYLVLVANEALIFTTVRTSRAPSSSLWCIVLSARDVKIRIDTNTSCTSL